MISLQKPARFIVCILWSYLNGRVYSLSVLVALKDHALACTGYFHCILKHKSIAYIVDHVSILYFWFSTVAKPARITGHPQELKIAVPGELLTFRVQVVGTEPLSYMWQCKLESEEWQSCNVESFLGANSPTLIIPSVQKSNEGSYRCTVSNCVGGENSEYARIIVGELNHCIYTQS